MTRYTLSFWLFNLYVGYFIQYAGLDKSQAGIKIAGRSINIHRYEDNTTLIIESKEELKSLLMRRCKNCLKTQHSKNYSQKKKKKLNNHGIQSHHFMAYR